MTALRRTRRALPLASLTRALWGLSGGLCCLGCGSDDDLATGYLGDTPNDPPRGDVLELTDPWWCLDRPPPELPAPRPNQHVGFVLPLVEWATLTPLAGRGLVASLCPGILFDCAQPLAQLEVLDRLGGTLLPTGVAGFPIIEGFDGFIKFQVSTPPGTPDALLFIPVSYYLGGPISGDVTQGQPVIMMQRGAWGAVLEQSFPQLDRQRVQATGTLITGVFDCNGNPVNEARVEISVASTAADGMTPFHLPASRIPIAQPAGPVITRESGMVGYVGVPQGAVQLRAFRREDTVPFAIAEVGSVPAEMSVASLRPAYVNTANLSATPPP